jgi:hypothetical protein
MDESGVRKRKGSRMRQFTEQRAAELERKEKTLGLAIGLLAEVYSHVGNHCPAEKRHVLPPTLRDRIRDLVHQPAMDSAECDVCGGSGAHPASDGGDRCFTCHGVGRVVRR